MEGRLSQIDQLRFNIRRCLKDRRFLRDVVAG